MIINDFKAFKGKHCETSSIGNLLINQGLNLSEHMIFGLGEGLSFIYWKMKSMNLPFLGGRNPSNTKRSGGRPATDIAAVSALGPGIE